MESTTYVFSEALLKHSHNILNSLVKGGWGDVPFWLLGFGLLVSMVAHSLGPMVLLFGPGGCAPWTPAFFRERDFIFVQNYLLRRPP